MWHIHVIVSTSVVDLIIVFLYEVGVYSINSSKTIGNFPKVLNFNMLFSNSTCSPVTTIRLSPVRHEIDLIHDKWRRKMKKNPNLQIICRAGIPRRIVPFCAVAAADVLNLGITCRDEFLQGIKVFDEHDDEIGQSRLAGARVVSACTARRIFATTPILVIPPLVMHRFVIDSLFILFHRAFPDTFPLQACWNFQIKHCNRFASQVSWSVKFIKMLPWMDWTLGFFFPMSRFGLIPSGFLEVLVHNLHNYLLDYSRYLWRSVADTQRQGSTAVPWWSQWDVVKCG